jgi:RimJ/RimL family protein N-acetyltransferase
MSKIIKQIFSNKYYKKIILRNAQTSDAGKIINIMKNIIKEDIYTLAEDNEYKQTIKKESEKINKFHKSKCKIYIVIEVNKKIAGYLTFDNFGIRKCQHNGLLTMFLDNKYRSKGLGTILMNGLIDWAKKDKIIEKLSLYVFANNEKAIGLYKKMGFFIEGYMRKDLKMRDGSYIDSVLMARFVKN